MASDKKSRFSVTGRRTQLALTPDGGFSYMSLSGESGWRHLIFLATLSRQTEQPRLVKTECESERCRILHFRYGTGGLRETVTLSLLNHPEALTVKRVFTNDGARPTRIRDVHIALSPDKGAVLLKNTKRGDARLIHLNNIRECHLRQWVGKYPYASPLPTATRMLGDSEDILMPLLAVSNEALSSFLVEGSLQQQFFTQMWRVNGNPYVAGNNPDSLWLEASAIAKDPHHQPIELAPGESAVLTHLYYEIRPDATMNTFPDGYLTALNQEHTFRGKSSSLLNEAFYCTWNYGFFRKIDERKLARQCAFIARNLPGVRHFLMDDGYQCDGNTPSYDAGRFYPDPDANIDSKRFPSGMKAFSDMIRKNGLKPALWWTSALGRRNALVKEHPEWLCLNEQGESWSMDSGTSRKAALDFSVPEARAFIEHMIETIFGRWGFSGMKLDFWSYPFECKDIFPRHGRSIHWRNWFLSQIGARITDENLFQVCGGVPGGNPFLGLYANHHRSTNDIGRGDWNTHQRTSCYNLPLYAIPGRATLLTDTDSAGYTRLLSDVANQSRLAYCHITQGALNLGGDLTTLSRKELAQLRRITDVCDRGHKVHCPDASAFTGVPLPDALYVDFPTGSRTHARGIRKEIAFFNWSDTPSIVGYPLTELGLSRDDSLLDFWTDKKISIRDGTLICHLPPMGSRLMSVRR